MHLFLIPDGHRRYSKKKEISLKESYFSATKTLKKSLKWVLVDNNIDNFTFFGFSYANFMDRSSKNKELIINALMSFLKDPSLFNLLLSNSISLRVIGEKNLWPDNFKKVVNDITKKTKGNHKIFTLLFCYSGKLELEHSINDLLSKKKKINYASMLENSLINIEIDYIIRTAGEKRISDGPLLPILYSEFAFTNVLFPELKKKHIDYLISKLKSRRRTFGA